MTVVPFPRQPDTTTHSASAQLAYNRAQPQHLRIALITVQAGRKSQLPGIRRCGDCAKPYIDDQSGLAYCRDCRTDHDRVCGHCRTRFRNTVDGGLLCSCCINQNALF